MKQIYFKLSTGALGVVLIGLAVWSAFHYFKDSETETNLTFNKVNEREILAETDQLVAHFSEKGVEVQFDGLEQAHQLKLHGIDQPSKPVVKGKNTVKYKAAYDGVDWVFYDKGNGQLGYDFVVAPGKDPGQIKIELEEEAFLNDAGELVINQSDGQVIHSAPISYQDIHGEKALVDSKFKLENNLISFEIGSYDPAYDLVIDPEIIARAYAKSTAMMSPAMGINGTVFRDYNSDGVQQGGEPGREGIIVRAYSDGTLPTKDVFLVETTTDASGNYSLNPPSYPVRLEFSIPSGLCNLDPGQDFSAPNGDTYGSAVQFADGPGTYNYIINYPFDYSTTDNPKVFVPCYINGDPSQSPAADREVFVGFNYLDEGYGANSGRGNNSGPPHEIVGNADQLGAVYGVAYSRQSKKIFTAAFLKRHVGLGPLGAGGIYMIDSEDYSTSYNYNWLDFDSDLGIPTNDEVNPYTNALTGSNVVSFSPVVGSNIDRGLTGDPTAPSQDAASWEQVGKVSFGDIDISEDGQFLFAVNLYDRKLYVIDLTDPENPIAPQMADVGTKVIGYDIPDPCVGNAGEFRPFALKFKRGIVYVGVVCSAQASNGTVIGTPDDMTASVFEFDLKTRTFNNTPVIDFPLNYRSGTTTPWIPWSGTFKGNCFECEGYPMLSDIEFDARGNMLLGMMDRRGHQMGIANYDLNGAGSYSMAATGDLLQAVRDTEESDCEYSISFTPEYYQDNLIHAESAQGGLAVHFTSETDNVMSTFLDPIGIWSGGTMRFDNLTGAKLQPGYEIFYSYGQGAGTLGKANGLGDIEAAAEVPSLEIGNRLWADLDEDGIQDGGEPGINEVIVQLKSSDGTLLAQTTTSQDGNFYFNFDNVPDGDPLTMGDQQGLQRFTDYKLCIPASEFDPGRPLHKNKLTLTDAVGVGVTDLSDNDAMLLGNNDLEITFQTKDLGENDHSLDFGVVPADWGDLPDSYTTIASSGGPWHWVTPSLVLGNCVDSEFSGTNSAMADGDDAVPGTRVPTIPAASYPCDDEDGVSFVTPMIAGYQACIEVTAVNSTGSAAELQGWIDFDGNGTFESGEQLNDVDFDAHGATVPNGGLTNVTLCFNVPADATFQGGMAMSRFRISPTGGLDTDGGNGYGEVEDYKLPLGKVGNRVWNDRDYDGIQEDASTEPGINGVEIQLVWAGPNGTIGDNDDETFTTSTAQVNGEDGIYFFCGLINGTYEITPNTDLGATLSDQTDDVNDSDDGENGVEFTIADVTALATGESAIGDAPGTTNGFGDAQDDVRFDFGFVEFDFGDLPDSYSTLSGNSGAVHSIIPDWFLGNCVDVEGEGQPGGTTIGDNDNGGETSYPDGIGCANDENGVEFITPMIPDHEACIEVDYSVGSGSAYFNAWIDFDGDGDFSKASDKLSFTSVDGVDHADGENVTFSGAGQTVTLCFDVPSDAVMNQAELYARFRLGSTPDMDPNGLVVGGEVEDYVLPVAKLGNLVWLDLNNNGIQDDGNTGVNSVLVNLIWAGPDGDLSTTNDNTTFETTTANDGSFDGIYYFCGLIEGTYEVELPFLPDPYDIATVDSDQTDDENDSDNHNGVTVAIADVTSLMESEAGHGDNPGSVNGFPDNQDEIKYDFALVVNEYGDLPDTYGTTGMNGAGHVVDIDLILGECIDSEGDGQPEAMAGMMQGGDDNTGSTELEYGNCKEGDEDGIVFNHPMIPGYGSCVRATVINNTGEDAFLQGWIDFNGNGVFDEEDELDTRDFAEGGVTIPDGGITNVDVCFDVPTTATFDGGAIFSRFRLSNQGGLSHNGVALNGEVEDYKINVAKVGNRVWEDRNYNGIQDDPTDDPGLNDMEVALLWAGLDGSFDTEDDVTYLTNSANIGGNDGLYYFCGLIDGQYEITVNTPRFPTLLDQGNEDVDSDDGLDGEQFTIAGVTNLISGEAGVHDARKDNFPDVQDDLRFDFGFVGYDYGDLPDGYGTIQASNGPIHVMLPGKYLGSCVGLDLDGNPDPDAEGDDANTSPFSFPVGVECSDDEDGIQFVTPLIPGYQACVNVNYTVEEETGYINAWIDFDNDGTFDAERDKINFLTIDGAANPGGENVAVSGVDQTVQLCFDVPADAAFDGGETNIRFRLGCEEDMEPTGLIVGGEVEDYHLELTKIGNLVWFDRNIDGLQDVEEASYGLNGVPVVLRYAGLDTDFYTDDDLTYSTTTQNYVFEGGADVDGIYYFCGLIDGKYRLEVDYDEDAGFKPSPSNQGMDDDQDSDGVEITGADSNPIEGVFGVMFEVDNAAGNPLNENGIADRDPGAQANANDVYQFPDLRVDQSFDFGLQDPDFGDLPTGDGFDYHTILADNAAHHVIPPVALQDQIPFMFLGTTVDADDDGQPAAMADGDDLSDEGDDEDGVRLLTPLIPGYEACMEVTVNIPAVPANTVGYLQAWMDFDGSGTLDADEQIITNDEFRNSDATNGNPVEICFTVPEDAIYYDGGLAYARFRLSAQPDLGVEGLALEGEVEDYKYELVKVGNLVWADDNEDANADPTDLDGAQTTGEAPFNEVDVQLTYAGQDNTFGTDDDRVYERTTAVIDAVNGQYQFCGLIAGDYQLEVLEAPEGYIPTVPDCAEEDLDSDGTPAIAFTVPANLDQLTLEAGFGDNDDATNFPDIRKGETYDFGFVTEPEIKSSIGIVGVDYPESEICGHFNVIFDACVKNTGGTPLKDLNAIADFKAAEYFGTTVYSIVSTPEILSSTAQSDPTPNAGFDGTNNLFTGTDGLLYPGEQVCVRFIIEVNPEAEGAPEAPAIQMEVDGKAVNYQDKPIPDFTNGGAPYIAEDLSDGGLDPMTSNPGYPGDTGGEDDLSPLMDCWETSREMAANDQLNVTLNATCDLSVEVDMLIENYLEECDLPLTEGSYYRVKVAAEGIGELTNPFDATALTGTKVTFIVENVTNFCAPIWGEILLEDKTPGDGCINKVVGLSKQAVSSSAADYFLDLEGPKQIEGNYYDYKPLTNEDPTTCIGDMVDTKYDGSNANHNLLICTDVDSILNVADSWTNKQYAYYVGLPEVGDNCSELSQIRLVRVEDELIDYECNYRADVTMVDGRLVAQEIHRTFTFQDEDGNEYTVEQVICFFKPILILPACKLHLNACVYDEADALDPVKIGSVPYVVNGACMPMPVVDHICNVTATYEDQRFPGPENCGFKVIRKWRILDWCWDELLYADLDLTALSSNDQDCDNPTFASWDNKSLIYEQHLVIDDQEDPVVICPTHDTDWDGEADAYVYTVNPLNCTTNFIVPEPTITNTECGYTYEVEIWKEVAVLWHGVPTGEIEQVLHTDYQISYASTVQISNLAKGAYLMKYIVTDNCGNTGESDYCPFYVIDGIEPVAVCNDALNISVGTGQGNDADGYGYSRVYAADLDEGSWDNCSQVWIQARRFVLEANIENYEAATNTDLSSDIMTLSKPGTSNDGQRGVYTPWAEYVEFTCDDAHANVLIELGVYDDANMDGLYNQVAVAPFEGAPFTQKDNFNTCWLEVLVEDKIAPICEAPHDVTLACDEVPNEVTLPNDGRTWDELSSDEQDTFKGWFSALQDEHNSYPKAWDNCHAEVEMIDVIFDLHCDAGTITRVFQAYEVKADGSRGKLSANTCTQVITLTRHHDYCIKFPKDIEATCQEAADSTGVDLTEFGCDLLAVSVQDERFDVLTSADECYKIFRTFRVINWCQFDEDVDPSTPLFDRVDTYLDVEPFVVGRDEDNNGVAGDKDVYVRFIGEDVNPDDAFPGSTGTTYVNDACDTETPYRTSSYARGFYQYTQVIKVHDNVDPAINAVGESEFPSLASPGIDEDKAVVCIGQVDRVFEVVEECTPDQLEIKLVILFPFDDEENAQVLYDRGLTALGTAYGLTISDGVTIDNITRQFTVGGQFPIGAHSMEVHVTDGCGNVDANFADFEVYDAKAPAPICLSSITVELMPVDENNDGTPDEGAGMQTIWASDFVASPIWDCSEPITYSVHNAAAVDSGDEVPNRDQTQLTVTCADAPVMRVYLYGWDAVGNHDRCEAMLILNDFMNLCEDEVSGSVSIAGLIQTESLETVSGVTVDLSGADQGNLLTAADGLYSFNTLAPGYDYTITPIKDSDHGNGVSTFDIVKVSKHILGVESLDSPYKLIAGDVDNSGSITTLDMIKMRKLVLNIDEVFVGNTSWRFIDAAYEFPDPTDPWSAPLPEVINLNDLDADHLSGDFIALKVGDVTGDAKVNLSEIAPRTIEGQFNLATDNLTMKAGETYEVPFFASDINEIQGLQFTMMLADAVQLQKVTYGTIKAENIGTHLLEDNILTASWNESKASISDSLMFNLVITAKQDIRLSEVIEINSRYTMAEAYAKSFEGDGGVMDIGLDFGDQLATASGFALFQNKPNPFELETVIGFSIPEAMPVTLSIFDVNGRLVKQYEENYERGYHEVRFENERLGYTGLMYYTLETAEFVATKKMILAK